MTRAVALLLALLTLAACRGTPARAPGPSGTAVPEGSRHLFVARLVPTPARRATFDAFVRRNPGPPWRWEGPEQVDRLAGYLRGARRDPDRPRRVSTPEAESRAKALTVEALDRAMTAFLETNADLLGVARSDLPKLQIDVDDFHHHGTLQFEPASRSVLAHGTIPMRGLLAFPELASKVSIVAAFDPDLHVIGFEHQSEIHPKISLTIDPRLGPDDPRVVAKVVGRRTFALLESGPAPEEPWKSRPRTRLELGNVAAEDVRSIKPDIQIAWGPLDTYRTYRLVYRVDVAKARPQISFPAPSRGGFFFFKWLVDPDTGDVVEDPQVPVVNTDADDAEEDVP